MARTVIPAQGWVVAKNYDWGVEEYAVLGFVVDSESDGDVQVGAIVGRGGEPELLWPDGAEYQLMREASDDE